MRLPVLLLAAATLCTAETVGTTRIATWQDDRTAAFLLMFDDGWPSHWQVAAPELQKQAEDKAREINAAYDRIKQLRKQ